MSNNPWSYGPRIEWANSTEPRLPCDNQPSRRIGLGSLTVSWTLPNLEYFNTHVDKNVVHVANSPWSYGPKIEYANSRDPRLA